MNDLFRSQFRLPNELADQLRRAAEASGRSMNAEVVARLESTLVPKSPSGDAKLAIDAYVATLQNQVALAELRIQMAHMQLANLHARTHQLVRESDKDVAKMSDKELEAADRVVDELKKVEREISQLKRELEDLQKNREAALNSIHNVHAAIGPRVAALEKAIAGRNNENQIQ